MCDSCNKLFVLRKCLLSVHSLNSYTSNTHNIKSSHAKPNTDINNLVTKKSK